MKPVSLKQKDQISNFLNNLSVAIITTGVIVPVFSKPESIYSLFASILIGVSLSLLLLALSLIIINERKVKNG